jgi:hypothetical protein
MVAKNQCLKTSNGNGQHSYKMRKWPAIYIKSILLLLRSLAFFSAFVRFLLFCTFSNEKNNIRAHLPSADVPRPDADQGQGQIDSRTLNNANIQTIDFVIQRNQTHISFKTRTPQLPLNKQRSKATLLKSIQFNTAQPPRSRNTKCSVESF